MRSLIYETPVGSEEDMLSRVMTAADVGLQGDHAYQNMVRRYRVCFEVDGRHIEPEEKQRIGMGSDLDVWDS